MPQSESCPICSDSVGSTRYRAEEMMFGHRETLEYVECGGCGCLRLVDVSTDLFRRTTQRATGEISEFERRAAARNEQGMMTRPVFLLARSS
jgi:hypothetical protein